MAFEIRIKMRLKYAENFTETPGSRQNLLSLIKKGVLYAILGMLSITPKHNCFSYFIVCF